MSIKDKIKAALVIVTFIAISFGSMYYGYKHPEIYINMYMDKEIMRGSTKINIRNICPPDPHEFTMFPDEYWCIA
jgi:hypothetical protein